MPILSWREHIKKVREEGNFTYKEAMIAASKSWKPNNKLTRIKEARDKPTKKDKMDESTGMEGQTKGSKSKTKEDFTTEEE